MLGVINAGPRDNGWGTIAMALFSIPFWIVGLGMFGGTLWTVRGKTSLLIDHNVMVTRRELFGLRLTREYARETVQYAREVLAKLQMNEQGKPRMVLEIVHRSGAFSLACDTDDERQWLISEINRFLGHAGPASGTQSLS